jgi:hypothetical protein
VETAPAIEEAVALFSNIPMLWSEATQDERRQLLIPLIEFVCVDLETKRGAAFRTLFRVGIDTSPDVPLKMVPQGEATKDIVGVGGDGGGSNSPSK